MKEATQQLLDKAAHAIQAAEPLLQAGDVEFATGRTYYATFYAAIGYFRVTIASVALYGIR